MLMSPGLLVKLKQEGPSPHQHAHTQIGEKKNKTTENVSLTAVQIIA